MRGPHILVGIYYNLIVLTEILLYMPQELLKGGSDLFLNWRKLLLSFGRILMHTIFAPDFFDFFVVDANERICVCF